MVSPPFEEVSGDDFDPTVPEFDQAHFKSISGVIIMILMTMIVISIFTCLARPDFTLPFLLIGYYIWCIDSSWSPRRIWDYKGQLVSEIYRNTVSLVYASDKTVKNIQGYTMVLGAVTVLDAIWILAGYAAWTCSFAYRDEQSQQIRDELFCFDSDVHRPLLASLGIHSFVLKLSLVNLGLKVLLILLQ